MEQAWREHCARLTPTQLSSTKACEEHLREFERQLVRQGLTGTLLSGCDDVQEVIANHLSGSISEPKCCPTAGALRALAESAKSYKIARMAEELAANARELAIEGEFLMEVRLRGLKDYGRWVVDENEVAQRVVASLRPLGYQSGASQVYDEQLQQWEPQICLAWI
tara:strand:- start:553 stop:1050 length:498 start_codon:yes stop_codon:yes gene_type:complete